MAFPTATATNGPNDTGSATLNALAGKITTGDLSGALWERYTLTVHNNMVVAGDMVFCSVANGTNNDYAGIPTVSRIQPKAGAFDVVLWKHSSGDAYDGTCVVSFWVNKAP